MCAMRRCPHRDEVLGRETCDRDVVDRERADAGDRAADADLPRSCSRSTSCSVSSRETAITASTLAQQEVLEHARALAASPDRLYRVRSYPCRSSACCAPSSTDEKNQRFRNGMTTPMLRVRPDARLDAFDETT